MYENDWEDMVVLLTKEDAINNKLGYTPTYNYYKNGELIVS
jgi:hypothetical protein